MCLIGLGAWLTYGTLERRRLARTQAAAASSVVSQIERNEPG